MAGKNGKRIRRLETLSHDALSALDRGRTALVATLSPLEVHGPHLPLGQDLMEGYALAERAVDKLAAQRPDWTFLLLPPVPVATDCVPKLGSVPFPTSLVREVAYRLLKPFAEAGFARLAFSSFHGGPRHVLALEAAAAQLTADTGVPAASLFSMVLARILEGRVFFDAVRDVPGREVTIEQLKRDQHAGFVETSLALHLWPNLVDEGWERLPGLTAETSEEPGKNEGSFLYRDDGKPTLGGRVRHLRKTAGSIVRELRHFRRHTYYGYPALASAAQGRALFEHLSDLAAQAAGEFIDRGTAAETHSPLWKLRHALLNPAANKIADDWLKILS